MTVYAHIENNEITGVYDLLPDNWRNISNFNALASETELLSQLGWRTIVRDTPNYDPLTQRLGNPEYKIVDGVVYETVLVIDTIPQVIETPSEPVYSPPSEDVLIQSHINAMMILRSKCKKIGRAHV